MSRTEVTGEPILKRMVRDLDRALGATLQAVVLYGSAARGDYRQGTSDLNLIIVLGDLDPPRLESLSPVLRWWRRQGQPLPRLFSPAIIEEAADVFPIELLDIRAARIVLHGRDPFAAVAVDGDHLRLQCERELREKMMRLREAYVEAHDSRRALARLLADSYTTFVALFRGCLHLLGGEVPAHNGEVVAAFCGRADLDASPFEEVDRLQHGAGGASDLRPLFARYYEALNKAVRRVDRFVPRHGGSDR
jgi:predicted nucleotidyltransferase